MRFEGCGRGDSVGDCGCGCKQPSPGMGLVASDIRGLGEVTAGLSSGVAVVVGAGLLWWLLAGKARNR